MKLILASASPRRAELLRQADIFFEVIKPSISEEVGDANDPEDLVRRLALKKALEVSSRLKSGYVLSADTIVVYRNQILGKPSDPDDARKMLRMLSGEQHMVITGLVLKDISTGCKEIGISKTRVWLKFLTDQQINAYVASGEPMDKAGAYGIQGKAALFTEKIEGCYFNVVGLPLSLLFELMTRLEVPIWLSGKDDDNG